MAEPPGAGVAIVGMAAVFPGASDVGTFWRNIVAGVDSITEAPADRWDPSYYDPTAPASADRFYCRRGGFVDGLVDFDPTRFGIMPVAVEGTEPDQLVALHVAAAAIEDAGGEARLPDRSRVGVVLGRGGYLGSGVARLDQRVRTAHQLVASLRELVPGLGEAQLDAVRRAFQDKLGPERPEASIGLVPNLAASRIANRLDLQGPAYTVDAACASSLLAVDQAVRELTAGRCDAVLAGGVHHCHDVTLWSVFTQLGALSPSQRIRPFDRGADGILIGEGTGMVLLKRLADAERDGDRVYAIVSGTGVASDGRASSLMAPRPDGQALAIERAWRAAGLDPTAPGAIGLVEAHGTATAAGDTTELASLGQVFGHEGSEPVGLGSVKSMIGHAMPAAGIAGLIKAALAVHHGVLPPTLHCDDPHPALAGSRFAPVTAAREWSGSAPRRAGVNAFGFGGINAHVVVSEQPRTAAVAAPPPVLRDTAPERVLLLSGRDARELALQLADDDALLARDDALSVGAQSTRDGVLLARDRAGLGAAGAAGPFRLAIVAPTAKRIALARRVVEQGKPWRGRNDIHFTGAPLLADGGGALAFVFPGLEQSFEPRVDDVAAHFGCPPPPVHATDRLGDHGLAVVSVGRLLDGALRELGLAPDVLAGHSVGEWNAMIAAGMYEREAVDAFIADFDAAAVRVPGVVFAALGCGADEAGGAIAGLDDVVVSHDNCPHQSIICGDRAAVDEALARLRARGVTGQVLPFRSGFHAPMLAPYLAPIRANAARMALRPATTPIWSATTLAPYPGSAGEVRELTVRHLVEPVRFRQLVRRLYDDAGVRAFVQVGTGSITGFVDDTLAGAEYVAISASSPKRPGLDQLRRVAASLWAEGLAPRFDRLPTAAVRSEPAPSPSRPAPSSNGAPSGTAPARGMPLHFGTPLVRFDGSVPPLRPAGAPQPFTPAGAPQPFTPAGAPQPFAPAGVPQPFAPGGVPAVAADPVLAEFHAVLGDATAAAQQVLASWRPAGTASPARPAAALPAAALPAAAVAESRATTAVLPLAGSQVRRVLSLETMPYLRDHCFYRQPEGWPEPSDRYPVVPMTTLLDLMRDAARELAPGRVVVGIRGVRALRWLAVAPPVTVTITAEPDADGNVDVTVEGYTRGTVLLADAYPPAPDLPDPPLARERPADIAAERLYADRWMFHGPAFQGVRELGPVGDDGIRGVLDAPPTPGALLDNAGQLMGLWIMRTSTVDRLAFPGAIDRLSFFGPDPTGPVRCAVRIRSVTDTEVTAGLELRTPDGRLWAAIDGWRDRRFGTDAVTWPMFTTPERTTIADEQPGGWFLARERWRDSATRELIMRRYLVAAERAEYEAHNPRAQRQWLLGRIAVKDAVRRWLWSRGAGPVFPAEIRVANAESGQPIVSGPFERLPAVSLAHTGTVAVAIARAADDGRLGSDDRPGSDGDGGVGIDIEAVAELPGVEQAALTEPERALLDRTAPPGERSAWLLRFWTAKEAAAKARGTGLAGRPRDVRVLRVEGERLSVVVHDRDGRPLPGQWIETRATPLPTGPDLDPTPYVVAWSAGEPDGT